MAKPESITHEHLLLIDDNELARRLARIVASMQDQDIDAALIAGNANLYYLTGRVYCGFVYIEASGRCTFAVRRPSHLGGDNVEAIRKIEELPALLDAHPRRLGLELGTESFAAVTRYRRAFNLDESAIANISSAINAARAVKTEAEIDKILVSAAKHKHLYSLIPHIYQPGMRDIDLQIELERQARLEGCLGQFRISGADMELFMGNVLVGENADTPSPYDFAMGGAGIDPSLPVGANGTLITRTTSVMVDFNGNYTGYMTDMTRCFALSPGLPDRAMRAHQCSIDICHELAAMGCPGVKAADLYHRAAEMAAEAGLEGEFMGHRQHASFVGHGLGIEINELPVIAPRSKSILEAGNIIALEPKFVIPGTGAVGIENTYLVTADGPMQCITDAPEEIILL